MVPATLPLPYSSYIPFFSVVVCTYNRADSVGAALDSLLAQTETDWECIIVDDGSTDDTAALLRTYTARSERFRLLYHSNRGQALSRNAGILASCGLFVTFLDSDDQYAPEHLSIRKQILCENTDVEFLYGGMDITGYPYVPDLENPGRMIHIGECIVAGTIVVRRNTAIQLGGFPNVAFGDDTAFYERAYQANIPIAQIDEPTYLYNRTRADSLCNLMADGGMEAIERYRQLR
jgi:glycosyltransferase involved in cell wall biosynthesis